MSENDNLHNADGNKETPLREKMQPPTITQNDADAISKEISNSKETDDESSIENAQVVLKDNQENTNISSAITSNNENPDEAKKVDAHVEEIDESNAEDAEDEENIERHNLESKDYHGMSMEQLSIEFEKLIEDHKVQNIKTQVDEIKSEFTAKFDALIEEKKEEFLNEGGNEIDFYFASPVKKQFNSVYKIYRNNLGAYYKQRENNLKSNLDNRLDIIAQIKGLVNDEENINTTYKTFKDLQEQWRNAGPIPRDRYNNAWNSYHHHVEIFYDVLHLNRDLRDLDFKHNC